MRVPSETLSIPLRTLVPGYRQLELPRPPSAHSRWDIPLDRKDTLLNATLHLPSPSRLTGLYLRRTSPETLVRLSLNSLRAGTQTSNPPPATLLAHVTHDAGKYCVEGLASTDNALVGLRGLWNFGSDLSTCPGQSGSETAVNTEETSEVLSEGLTDKPPATSFSKSSRPSLLCAGGEFYYSPLSSVIGLSTGLRFTTLQAVTASPATSSRPSKPLSGTSSALTSQLPSHISGSSFPYTLTLTLTPLTGSLASTYSVRASPFLSLSSRFGFNVYSWESEYVLGAEIWRKSPRIGAQVDPEPKDNLEWARKKMAEWYEEGKAEISGLTSSTTEPSSIDSPSLRILETKPTSPNSTSSPPKLEESVIKLRLDDRWNFRALWTGRIKELLVSTGFSVGPASKMGLLQNSSGGGGGGGSAIGNSGPFQGSFGVEVVYSS
ncbi:putative mitochondrial protein [Phaeomoniella chlamydospora]|uniref:Putative mitochondrial protein n=1 Tax=Phaeomoniella chlamydospora TaxID=158046 RepID=A0A0G2EE03_PHACM|nr:putative mitochondrial protein [Phaeomoniella chlamydospora]